MLVVLRCCTGEGSVLSTLSSSAPGMTQTKQQDQPPRPWDRFISDLDRKVYSECGFGAPVGLGQRPTLLIIDAQYRSTGESSDPILEAMKQYATAVGEEGGKLLGKSKSS